MFAEKVGLARWFMFSGIAAAALGLASLLNPLNKPAPGDKGRDRRE
jgi:hypothetical protein